MTYLYFFSQIGNRVKFKCLNRSSLFTLSQLEPPFSDTLSQSEPLLQTKKVKKNTQTTNKWANGCILYGLQFGNNYTVRLLPNNRPEFVYTNSFSQLSESSIVLN